MIPLAIKKSHVLKALEGIRTGGVPRRREPTKFYLVHSGRRYPPKFALSLAAKHATGQELLPEDFSGGIETNSFLTDLGFKIEPKREDWSWRECYFAVWGYDQLDIDPSQVKTSLYKEIAELLGRSPKAVEFKVQNVSSFDPRPRSQKPIAEARNAQALLGEVFRWYWKDRALARTHHAQFREDFQFESASTMDPKAPDGLSRPNSIIEEGASDTAPSFRRKRSQKLVEEGRKYFRAQDKDGKLRCRSCGFTTPNEVELEIVQLHHTEPIYESDEKGRRLSLKAALERLLPLCPTCHGLAHSSRPPLAVEVIRALRSTPLAVEA
jgi:predicted HNH restriction endonuclease